MLSIPEYHTSNKRHKAIYQFLSILWREQPTGFMYLGIKSGTRFKTIAVDGGAEDIPDYDHLRAVIEKFSDNYDFYFRPSTFCDPEGIKSNAHWTQILHVDIDEGNILKAWTKPTFLWETSPGRYQAIWILDQRIPREEAEKYNRAIAKACSADGSGWECTKFLRVPFTFNHKPGRRRFMGRMVEVGPTGIETRPKIVMPERSMTQGGHAVVDREWAQALAREGVLETYPRTGLRMYLGPCGEGRRSVVIYKIMSVLIERGASNEEAACVVRASQAFQSKYGNSERDGWKEIERLCRKVRSKLH